MSQTNKGLKVTGEGSALVFCCSLCYLATDDTIISTVLTGRETLEIMECNLRERADTVQVLERSTGTYECFC